MRADTVIRSRVDSKTKLKADRLFRQLGLSMSDAIRLFLNQSIANKGLPFDVKIPNAQTLSAIDELDKGKGIKTSVEGIKRNWKKASEK